jgi:hypothetical protein
MTVHDDNYCLGKRRDDKLDQKPCHCGHKHYRCSTCYGIVDGLHDDLNRWDGARFNDWEIEEERWR